MSKNLKQMHARAKERLHSITGHYRWMIGNAETAADLNDAVYNFFRSIDFTFCTQEDISECTNIVIEDAFWRGYRLGLYPATIHRWSELKDDFDATPTEMLFDEVPE